MNILDRRDFLVRAAALAGASLLPFSNFAQAEPPPEVGRIRIAKIPAICLAPEYLAEEMLKLDNPLPCAKRGGRAGWGLASEGRESLLNSRASRTNRTKIT